MFTFQDTRGVIDVAFTDRHGGVSGGPYASLNLAESGGDDHDTVRENLEIIAHAFARGRDAPDADRGVRAQGTARAPILVWMHQVHGSRVHVVRAEDVAGASCDERRPIVADALVTTVPGVVLMVRAADCLPVLLADVERGVVGAAHAGRPGLVAGVVGSAIDTMRALGASHVCAWLGPHVCGRCYEVPEVMRAQVADVVPQAYAETSWGTPSIDIGRGVRSQLDAENVAVIDTCDRCTMEDRDLFSYRRQGTASGRQAGLVWVRQ